MGRPSCCKITGVDFLIRRAEPSEAESVADLMWRVRQQSLGAIPPGVHPLDDVRRWMRDAVFPSLDVWVAEASGDPSATLHAPRSAGSEPPGSLVGMMVLKRPDLLEHLYINAPFTGHGLGSRFLELAKQQYPGGLQLWTFQTNIGARRFYERLGFVPVEWTDGDNEECAPDVRYEWQPA